MERKATNRTLFEGEIVGAAVVRRDGFERKNIVTFLPCQSNYIVANYAKEDIHTLFVGTEKGDLVGCEEIGSHKILL